jgi:xanthine dehydrogenase accessory factor
MRDVLRHLTWALDEGREALLCQVVETKGSTPQKAGALMLVSPDGGQVGTLGGGCVENEVKQRAIRRLGREGAELHAFVLDHDHAWADGLICGGKMTILAQAYRGDEAASYFRTLLACVESGAGFTEAVALDPERSGVAEIGTRGLFGPDGAMVASLGSNRPTRAMPEAVESVDGRPRPRTSGGWAYLPTLPRVRLVIVGAGHVGQAVGELAARSDFEVWVVDDRRQYASPERFPHAARLVVGPIGEVLPALEITPRTYALIVTRGHGHDEEALFHLAPTVAPYVGLIGSRRKIRLIFESLREQGVDDSALARVSAAVGLDIGSESVPEIAVSIVAELIARRNLGPRGAVGNAFCQPAPSPA